MSKHHAIFTPERWDRAIWMTVLEAIAYRKEGNIAEGERLLDLAANAQWELDNRNGGVLC